MSALTRDGVGTAQGISHQHLSQSRRTHAACHPDSDQKRKEISVSASGAGAVHPGDPPNHKAEHGCRVSNQGLQRSGHNRGQGSGDMPEGPRANTPWEQHPRAAFALLPGWGQPSAATDHMLQPPRDSHQHPGHGEPLPLQTPVYLYGIFMAPLHQTHRLFWKEEGSVPQLGSAPGSRPAGRTAPLRTPGGPSPHRCFSLLLTCRQSLKPLKSLRFSFNPLEKVRIWGYSFFKASLCNPSLSCKQTEGGEDSGFQDIMQQVLGLLATSLTAHGNFPSYGHPIVS